MLASLLPGLRSVRTPLVVGSLYFLALWLTVGPDNFHFSRSGQSVAEKRVAALLLDLPSAATWSAAALAAVLVGSLLTIQRIPRIVLGWLRGGDDRPREQDNPIRDDYYNDLARRLSEFQLTGRQVNESGVFQPPPFVPKEDSQADPESAGFVDSLEETLDGGQLVPFVSEQVRHEAEVLLTRLKVERESLWNDVDRQRSESELRYSIIPPLVWIVGCLAVTWHWAAVIALLPVVGLGRQALQIEEAADAEVFTALRHGVIESPTMDALASLAQQTSANPDARDVTMLTEFREDLGANTSLLKLVRDMNFAHFSGKKWHELRETYETWTQDPSRRFHDRTVQDTYAETIDALGAFIARTEDDTWPRTKQNEPDSRGLPPEWENGNDFDRNRYRTAIEEISRAQWEFLEAHRRFLRKAHDRGL